VTGGRIALQDVAPGRGRRSVADADQKAGKGCDGNGWPSKQNDADAPERKTVLQRTDWSGSAEKRMACEQEENGSEGAKPSQVPRGCWVPAEIICKGGSESGDEAVDEGCCGLNDECSQKWPDPDRG
jgi:hypothetical protein